jgi:DNA-binding GntR family transcriptional regulator
MDDKTETLPRTAAPPDKQVAPESLTSRIYARLRDDILAGRLEPGRKLKIEDLRKSYGIGASPIREALSHLASDHLVERLDQRGFRVANVGNEEFDELLKTRCWLEERALRESIAHGNSDWEERIVLAAYRLSSVPRSTSTDRFIANSEWESLHKAFHKALISACGSAILLRFCDQLYDQNIRYRVLSNSMAYRERDTSAEHEAIKEAALARDADLAVERLLAHYARTGSYLRDKIG